MHIHDFYSKLTSGTEGGSLFTALRNLSSLEDFNVLLDELELDWPTWDPTGGSGSGVVVSCIPVQA
ncbi:MAG: hypothetical protein DMF53_12980 [Acidobacteria bacterium]|nr:MAG: hypothetical protein DMF53_12980 [Acidobacteriota bacterium]